MLTITQLWLYGLIPGLGLAAMGFVVRRFSIAAFAIGAVASTILSYDAFAEAFIESALGPPLSNEMGSVWAFHSVVSSLSPAILTGVVLLWQRIRGADQRKAHNKKIQRTAKVAAPEL